jgi:hypothetical protein
MRFKRCPNPICGRPFQVNQFGINLAPIVELGKVTCPHCGLLLSDDINSVFLTHALSTDEEAIFNANNPVNSIRNQECE